MQIDEVIDKILKITEMDILSDWLDAKKKKIIRKFGHNYIHGYKVDRIAD